MIRPAMLWTTLFASVLGSATAQAGIFVPPGLHPGDHYYLAFITRDSRDATSSNIADYNQFVQNQAAQNPALTGTDQGIQWRAIASTPTVSAQGNLALQPRVPIYLLDGARLVDADASTLLSSPRLAISPDLAFPIYEDQFGIRFVGEDVWTGTLPGGTTAGTTALGGTTGTSIWAIAQAEPFDAPFTRLDAIEGAPFNFQPAAQNIPGEFYAVSTILAVPEPASSWLLLIGGGVLGSVALTRRRMQVRPRLTAA